VLSSSPTEARPSGVSRQSAGGLLEVLALGAVPDPLTGAVVAPSDAKIRRLATPASTRRPSRP
jgi:hypothetical protein